MRPTCGRPTKRDQPCTLSVTGVIRWPQPSYQAPACGFHLTDDERHELEVEKAAEAEVRAAASSVPPACHTWPEVERLELEPWEEEFVRHNPGTGERLRLAHELSNWQAGRCAICGRGGGSVEDHCHLTGLFRGLLCRGCNVREGRSSTATIQLYRERPPAAIVGFTYQYSGYGHSDGAQAQGWVVEALGPVPPDCTPEAVAYLLAATTLPPPWLGGLP